MNKEEYEKYYQKGGTYVIPTEVFNNLLDEKEQLIEYLEELKYTMFASDKLKKTINENIKARNIYQDVLGKIKSSKKIKN